MADQNPSRRNSEGVVTIRHPRSDFPQQGWIRKPTVNNTTIDFYEAITDFGWYSETQSYRSADKAIGYGRWQRSKNRQFYQTEPQQGWLAKPVLTGGSALYEASTGFGWYAPTQAYRSDAKQIKSERPRAYYQTEPRHGWTPSELFPDSWTIVSGQTSVRPDRGRTWRINTPEDTSWIYPTLPVAFDPAVLDWHIKSSRTIDKPVSRTRLDTSIESAWIFQNLVVAFDPATLDWHIDTSRTLEKPVSRVRRDTNTDTSWLSLVNPITGWTFPDVRLWPRPRYQRETNYATAFIAPERDPAIQDWTTLSSTYLNRNRKPNLSCQTPEWIVPTFPVSFDPSLYPAVAQLNGLRTPARRALQVQRAVWLYEYSWLRDVIPLPDPAGPVVPPPPANEPPGPTVTYPDRRITANRITPGLMGVYVRKRRDN